MRAHVRAHALDERPRDAESVQQPCNTGDIMRIRRFQFSVRGLRLLFLTPLAILFLQGCTDLEESPTSVITPDNFFGS